MDTNTDEKKEEYLNSAIEVCKKYNIIFPTFRMLENPNLNPEKIKEELKNIGMNELNPFNLFEYHGIMNQKKKEDCIQIFQIILKFHQKSLE